MSHSTIRIILGSKSAEDYQHLAENQQLSDQRGLSSLFGPENKDDTAILPLSSLFGADFEDDTAGLPRSSLFGADFEDEIARKAEPSWAPLQTLSLVHKCLIYNALLKILGSICAEDY